MGCNCKNVTESSEIIKIVDNEYRKKRMKFWDKVKIICDFMSFYFIYVHTSVFNFILTDKLEPVLPTKLLKKYESYGNG